MKGDVRGVRNPLDAPKDQSADLGNFSSLFGTSQYVKIFFGYLATGDNLRTTAVSYRLQHSTAHSIVSSPPG